MYRSLLPVILSAFLCFSPESGHAAAPLQFPADIGWTDITTAPYNCIPDGQHDCTAAINAAIMADGGARWHIRRLIYFPAGTYLVSGRLEWRDADGEWYGYISFQGQGTDHTVIRLQDGCPGYTDSNVLKAVVFTADQVMDTVGNESYDNFIRDLTVHTGSGNPGAVAVDYIANNGGGLRNVRIVSGDGQGYAGLRMERRWAGPTLIKNVAISGFDYGITVDHLFYSQTFEHIRLEHQNEAAVINSGNIMTFRDLVSVNTVPAVVNDESHGQVIVIDGLFTGGADSVYAIANAADLYLRNVSCDGYKGLAADVPGDTVAEYFSGKPLALFERPEATSLHLPVKETPVYDPADTGQWASARLGLQNALNSGRPVVYLPFDYEIEIDTFDVPATVRKVVAFMHKGMGPAYDARYKQNRSIAFKVEENAAEPVVFDHMYLATNLYGSTRDLVLVDMENVNFVSLHGATGEIYIENYCCEPMALLPGQRFWARQLNIEYGDPYFYNDGGTAWILGYKSEWPLTLVHNVNNAATEWLGGLMYPVSDGDTDHPLIINDESEVSAIYSEYGLTQTAVFPIHVQETWHGVTRSLPRDSMKTRGWGKQMSLYVGHEGSRAGTVALNDPVRIEAFGGPLMDITSDGITVRIRTRGSVPACVDLYGQDGRRVERLVRGTLDPGINEFVVKGKAIGIYIVRVVTAGESVTRPVLLGF